MSGKTDHVSDILELVESHYLPRIAIDQDKVKAHKNSLEIIQSKIFKLEESPGKIKDGASEDQLNKYN